VSVRGSGLGGRNQEMVLSYLVETAENPASLDELEVVFLSAGTDGNINLLTSNCVIFAYSLFTYL
jgi:glycerate-2-kinase